MADGQAAHVKRTVDKDLSKLTKFEEATGFLSRGLVAPGLGFIFIALAAAGVAFYFTGAQGSAIIIAASAIGAYMALNIGANDVANNVGPAVGAKALTMGGALLIAAVFESAGALLAGGDVVSTIAKGIVDRSAVSDPQVFVYAMLAALISSALWVNFATFVGAPVSTTHAVVGGVMGAGIAAAGMSAVNWNLMGAIAASWVISPLLGGIIAAVFLALIKTLIVYQKDKIAAARRWVPILIGIMGGAFSCYMALKGLKKIIHIDAQYAVVVGVLGFVVLYLLSRPFIRHQSEGMENRNSSLRQLFQIPLICSAALLSFAHGANDVANAVGPLAAIVHTVQQSDVAARVDIPFWVMIIGAVGISMGLVLFGPKLVRMVGQQITKLNPMRAYCVALSAAITVIVASWLGLPVSSTHIAVGAVFGVGFFREWYTANSKRRKEALGNKVTPQAKEGTAEEIKRRKLVRRSHFMTIVAAWVITVPASALLSGLIFLGLSMVLL